MASKETVFVFNGGEVVRGRVWCAVIIIVIVDLPIVIIVLLITIHFI
jgi:hypothetical protein